MADIASLARELADLLQKESAYMKAVSTKLAADRKSFISGSSRALAGAEAGWNALLQAHVGRDRERALLMDRIAVLIGEPSNRINVSKVCKRLDATQAAHLRRCADALTLAARNAALEAAVGGDLLNESARFQLEMIRRICDAAEHKTSFYGQGEPKTRPPLTLLDTVG